MGTQSHLAGAGIATGMRRPRSRSRSRAILNGVVGAFTVIGVVFTGASTVIAFLQWRYPEALPVRVEIVSTSPSVTGLAQPNPFDSPSPNEVPITEGVSLGFDSITPIDGLTFHVANRRHISFQLRMDLTQALVKDDEGRNYGVNCCPGSVDTVIGPDGKATFSFGLAPPIDPAARTLTVTFPVISSFRNVTISLPVVSA